MTRTAEEITKQWVLAISRRVRRARDLLGVREQGKPIEGATAGERATAPSEPEQNISGQGFI